MSGERWCRPDPALDSFGPIRSEEAACPWIGWCTSPVNPAMMCSETTDPGSERNTSYSFVHLYLNVMFSCWTGVTLSWEKRLDLEGASSYGRSAIEAMILFLWPSRPIFNTCVEKTYAVCFCKRWRVQISLGEWTYIDYFKFPQILHTLQSSVTAGQKVVQILSKTQSFQPRRQRRATVTSQSFHLTTQYMKWTHPADVRTWNEWRDTTRLKPLQKMQNEKS